MNTGNVISSICMILEATGIRESRCKGVVLRLSAVVWRDGVAASYSVVWDSCEEREDYTKK